MPVLDDATEVVTIFLPSTKDEPNEDDRFWVRFDVSPKRARDLRLVERNDNPGETTIKQVAVRVKEWNCTNADGVRLPINEQTLGLLDFDDFLYLQDQIKEGRGGMTAAEKKASSPTPSPSEVSQTPAGGQPDPNSGMTSDGDEPSTIPSE